MFCNSCPLCGGTDVLRHGAGRPEWLLPPFSGRREHPVLVLIVRHRARQSNITAAKAMQRNRLATASVFMSPMTWQTTVRLELLVRLANGEDVLLYLPLRRLIR